VSTGRIKWDAKLTSSPYGGATIANDVVFTTTYDGTIYGYDVDTGQRVWSTRLPAGTNTPVAVTGDTLLTAASLPAPGHVPFLTAFRLGGNASFPTPKPTSTTPAAKPTTPEHAGGSNSATSASIALVAKGNKLAYDSTKKTAKAGKVRITFTNASTLPHNVVLQTASGKTVGKTPTFSGGHQGPQRGAESRQVHVLLLGSRPPPGRDGWHADRQVTPWPSTLHAHGR